VAGSTPFYSSGALPLGSSGVAQECGSAYVAGIRAFARLRDAPGSGVLRCVADWDTSAIAARIARHARLRSAGDLQKRKRLHVRR